MALLKLLLAMADIKHEPRPGSWPWAWFITFSCYGARLHGSESGSVDRDHNAPGTPMLPVDARRQRVERSQMREAPASLSSAARTTALAAIRDACAYRRWILHAAHVRSNHVHVVVASRADASELLQKLKSRASRALNEEFGRRRWWAYHGSTIPLWNTRRVDDAVEYTWRQEGEPMARYRNPNRWQEYADSDL